MNRKRYLFLTDRNEIVASELCQSADEANDIAAGLVDHHGVSVTYFAEVATAARNTPPTYEDYLASIEQDEARIMAEKAAYYQQLNDQDIVDQLFSNPPADEGGA